MTIFCSVSATYTYACTVAHYSMRSKNYQVVECHVIPSCGYIKTTDCWWNQPLANWLWGLCYGLFLLYWLRISIHKIVYLKARESSKKLFPIVLLTILLRKKWKNNNIHIYIYKQIANYKKRLMWKLFEVGHWFQWWIEKWRSSITNCLIVIEKWTTRMRETLPL